MRRAVAGGAGGGGKKVGGGWKGSRWFLEVVAVQRSVDKKTLSPALGTPAPVFDCAAPYPHIRYGFKLKRLSSETEEYELELASGLKYFTVEV